MQQSLDDADLVAANLHAAHVKSIANQEAVTEADNSVNIFKIKLIATLDQKIELVEKRREELKTTKEKSAEKALKMNEIGGDVAVAAQAVMASIEEYHKNADEYLQKTFGGRLGALKTRSVTASSRDEINAIRAELTVVWKELNQEDVRTFVQFVKTFNMQSPSVGRRSKPDKQEEQRAIESAPRHPLFVSMMESLDQGIVNCSSSIFEAKGGLRPAVLPITSQETFNAVALSPVLRKAIKCIASSCSKGTAACCQPLEGGTAVINRFNTAVQTAVGMELLTRCALPRSEWGTRLWGYEAVGYGSKPHANVAWSPYGMMSGMICLEGDYAMLGIAEDEVEGGTFQEKRTSFLRYTIDDILKKLNSGRGWFVRIKDGVTQNGDCVVVLPSGFIVATAGQNARVLRWPLFADAADTARVKHSMRGMLESFPEFRSTETGYPQFAEFLGLQV